MRTDEFSFYWEGDENHKNIIKILGIMRKFGACLK